MAISLQPFFVSPSIAAEKGSLVIDPLTTNVVDKGLLAAISNHVREYIVSSNQYEILEKDAAIKGGGGLLLGGSLVKLGAKFIVNLRLVDLDTGEVIKKARESSSEEDILNRLESAVLTLIGVSPVFSKSSKDEELINEGFGFLYLKSEPPGARIVLNGEGARVTPRALELLKSGRYNVKLIKDGYFVWEKDVVLGGGSVINIMAELKTIYGSLKVASSPPGADVSIDGDFAGKTPFTVDKLEGGKYEIVIALEGYGDYAETVHVKAGASHEVLTLLDETEAHREYRLARKRRTKKKFWAFGTLALSGITAAKAYTDYSDSEDAYSEADDAYSSYKNSEDPVMIDHYRNLTESYKEEAASKAEDGDNALILSGALLAFSIYNFYTMPPKAEYEETAFFVPEIRGGAMFLAWKKRY